MIITSLSLSIIISVLVILRSIGLHVVLLLNCVKTYKDCDLNSLCNNDNNVIHKRVYTLADKHYIWPNMLYFDLTPTTYSSLYPLLVYLRLSLCVVLICLTRVSIDYKFGISVLLIYQATFMTYSIATTVYRSWSNYIIQAVSNFTMVIILLIHYWNFSSTNWSDTVSYAYMSVILTAFVLMNMAVIKEYIQLFLDYR